MQRFREATAPQDRPKTETSRRTIGELLSARDGAARRETPGESGAEGQGKGGERPEGRQAAGEAPRLPGQAAAREPGSPSKDLIGRKTSASYDEAVGLLVDLREIARRLGTERRSRTASGISANAMVIGPASESGWTPTDSESQGNRAGWSRARSPGCGDPAGRAAERSELRVAASLWRKVATECPGDSEALARLDHLTGSNSARGSPTTVSMK